MTDEVTPTREQMAAFIEMLVKARIFISDQHDMLIAILSHLRTPRVEAGDVDCQLEATWDRYIELIQVKDSPMSGAECFYQAVRELLSRRQPSLGVTEQEREA